MVVIPLLFPKVPQSSPGILRVPQLPPPPPLGHPPLRILLFLGGVWLHLVSITNKKTRLCGEISLYKILPIPPCLVWKQCAHHGPSTRELSLRMLAYGPGGNVGKVSKESGFLLVCWAFCSRFSLEVWIIF